MCFIFHKWDKWKEYQFRIPEQRLTERWILAAATERRQRRICKECGLIQDKLINTEVD